MGYYSDTAIAMYQNDYLEMLKAAADTGDKDILNWVTDCCERYAAHTGTGTAVILRWSCVKWYPDFRCVRFTEDWVGEDGRSYAFLRVGEDYEDVEERSTDDNLAGFIYLERYIGIDSDGAYDGPKEPPDATEQESDDELQPQDDPEAIASFLNA